MSTHEPTHMSRPDQRHRLRRAPGLAVRDHRRRLLTAGPLAPSRGAFLIAAAKAVSDRPLLHACLLWAPSHLDCLHRLAPVARNFPQLDPERLSLARGSTSWASEGPVMCRPQPCFTPVEVHAGGSLAGNDSSDASSTASLEKASSACTDSAELVGASSRRTRQGPKTSV